MMGVVRRHLATLACPAKYPAVAIVAFRYEMAGVWLWVSPKREQISQSEEGAEAGGLLKRKKSTKKTDSSELVEINLWVKGFAWLLFLFSPQELPKEVIGKAVLPSVGWQRKQWVRWRVPEECFISPWKGNCAALPEITLGLRIRELREQEPKHTGVEKHGWAGQGKPRPEW